MFLKKLENCLKQTQSLFIGEDSAFRSAILIPLVQVNNEWHILFQVRSFTMRKQPGDICFPGGRIDLTDQSPLAAALRETHEELGVDPETVNIVSQLSPYISSPSFVVYPFVATIDYNQIIHSYNKDEVEEIFTVPIDWLLNYEPYMHKVPVQPIPSPDFPFEKIYKGLDYKWRARIMEEWFFDYENYTIWGLTARVLKHFIEVLKK